MKQAIKAFIKGLPFIRNLVQQVKDQGAFPAGHYYFPIPSKEEILYHVQTRGTPNSELPGINLNEKKQLELLEEYINFIQIYTSRKNKSLPVDTITTINGLATLMRFFCTVF